MRDEASARRVWVYVWLYIGVFAVVAVAVLFAPLMTVTAFGDSPTGGTVNTDTRSVVNIVSNVWLWLGVTILVVATVALGAWLTRPRARVRPRPGTSIPTSIRH